MPEGLGGGSGEELMTQKRKSSGNYALRYGSATQIQLLALFQIPFPNWSVSRLRNIPFQSPHLQRGRTSLLPVRKTGVPARDSSVYEVNILLPGAYTRDIWIFLLNPKFLFHSSLYSLEVKDLESRKHMAPACLPSSLLGVTISQSITHTLLPSDPSQWTLVCIHFLIFSKQMPTQKKKKAYMIPNIIVTHTLKICFYFLYITSPLFDLIFHSATMDGFISDIEETQSWSTLLICEICCIFSQL